MIDLCLNLYMSDGEDKKIETNVPSLNIEPNPEIQQKSAEAGAKSISDRSALRRKMDISDAPDFDISKLKSKKIDVNKFKANADATKSKLDTWKLSINQENARVSVEQWDYESLDGLNEIYADVSKLGVLSADIKFYNECFTILRDALDPNKNNFLDPNADPSYAYLFQDPVLNLSKIENRKSNTFDGAAYVIAFQHLIFVQSIALANDDSRRKLGEKKGFDGYTDAAGNFIGDLGDGLSRAVDEKNWPVVAAYATGGIVALAGAHGLWKKFTDGNDKNKYAILAILGVGAVAAGTKYGNDVWREMDEELDVNGSSLSMVHDVLTESPSKTANELAEKLDYQLLARMNDRLAVDMYERMKESDANNLHFISPHDFPSVFPDFMKEVPKLDFTPKNDQELLTHYSKGSNLMSSSNARFVETGRRLYDIALAMKLTYEESLQKYDPNYSGKSFEEAIYSEDLKGSRMLHMFDSVRENWRHEKERRDLEKNNMQTNLIKLFEQRSNKKELVDVNIDKYVSHSVFSGTINGYPVLVELDPETNNYKFYAASDVIFDSVKSASKELGNIEKDSTTATKNVDALLSTIKSNVQANIDVHFMSQKVMKAMKVETLPVRDGQKLVYSGDKKWTYSYVDKNDGKFYAWSVIYDVNGKMEIKGIDAELSKVVNPEAAESLVAKSIVLSKTLAYHTGLYAAVKNNPDYKLNNHINKIIPLLNKYDFYTRCIKSAEEKKLDLSKPKDLDIVVNSVYEVVVFETIFSLKLPEYEETILVKESQIALNSILKLYTDKEVADLSKALAKRSESFDDDKKKYEKKIEAKDFEEEVNKSVGDFFAPNVKCETVSKNKIIVKQKNSAYSIEIEREGENSKKWNLLGMTFTLEQALAAAYLSNDISEHLRKMPADADNPFDDSTFGDIEYDDDSWIPWDNEYLNEDSPLFGQLASIGINARTIAKIGNETFKRRYSEGKIDVGDGYDETKIENLDKIMADVRKSFPLMDYKTNADGSFTVTRLESDNNSSVIVSEKDGVWNLEEPLDAIGGYTLVQAILMANLSNFASKYIMEHEADDDADGKPFYLYKGIIFYKENYDYYDNKYLGKKHGWDKEYEKYGIKKGWMVNLLNRTYRKLNP